MSSTPAIEVLSDELMVRIGAHDVKLTRKELDVFDYLRENAGRVVTRRELETEVWQFRAGVKSEVAPVTLRRLRRKLGEHSELIETMRCVGWRFAQTVDHDTATTPQFSTPYHPREEHESKVSTLLQSWPIVTIVGTGGVGKSRLAAAVVEAHEGPMIWVNLHAARTKADAVRMLLAAAGVHTGDEKSLASSLIARDNTWVVLDAASAVREALQQLLPRLPGVSFLVTSRQDLGVAGEAVHELRGLDPESGINFLRARLAASRWSADVDDTLMARAVQVLDGLPLGLEVAAAHPFGLLALVEDLEQGALPQAPEQEPLLRMLRESLQPLDPALTGCLRSFCLSHGALTDADIGSWLGRDAIQQTRELASRSLIQHSPRGWSVASTLRAYVRAQSTDWPALQQSYDAWLVERAAEHADAFYSNPHRVGVHWMQLTEDMIDAIDRVPAEQAPGLVRSLLRFYTHRGPIEARNTVIRRGLARAPDDLGMRMLGMLVSRAFDEDLVAQAERSDDLGVRRDAVRIRRVLAPNSLNVEVLDALIGDLDGVERQVIEYVRALATMLVTPDDALTQLHALRENTRSLPGLQARVLQTIVGALQRAERFADSEQVATEALAIAQQHNLPHIELQVLRARATGLSFTDPLHGAEAFVELADRCAVIGVPSLELHCRCAAGVLFYTLGELERSKPLLTIALQGRTEDQAWARWMLAALRLRQGDTEDLEALEGLTGDAFAFRNYDGTPAGPQLAAYLRAEAHLHRARAEGTLQQALKTLIAERALELNDRSSLELHLLQADLERRAE